MKKLFISGMAFDSGQSGISDYIVNVVREILEHASVDLLLLKKDLKAFPVRHENLRLILVPNCLEKPVINMLWHLFAVPFCFNLKKYDGVFLPAGNRRLLCTYPVKSVATVHDLSQFHIEGKYDAFRMFYIRHIIPYFLKKADYKCAISESTKKDMMRFFNTSESEIVLNYNGYDDRRFHNEYSSGKELPGIYDNGKYILYIARIEHPGKNHVNLMKAYEMLPEEIKDEYKLIMPGKQWSGSEAVMEYHNNSKDRDSMIFPGFVDGDLLPEIYRAAALYAFPSFFEGFGIPMLEAMACGTPVVCSDTPSLVEVGGDAVKIFDPKSPESISETIYNALTDESLRSEMKEKGLNRVKDFSWKAHVLRIMNCFNI